jgi:outer membrane protein assembly factor BamB
MLVLVHFSEYSQSAEAEYSNPFLPDGVEDRGWPFVRGLGFDGHSPEIHIADQWPKSGPPVLWIRELGQGYSAFVALRDRVYTQAQSLGGQFVYCLNADTGETLWRYRYGAPYEFVGLYPGPRATPTLSEGHVYFAAPNGLIGCLTADKGKLVWSKNVLEEYGGLGGVNFGYSCSPTVIDGMVFLPVGGPESSLVALKARDGTEIWSSGSDPGSYSPAFPITLEGRKLLVGYLENSLVVLDRGTGKLLVRLDISHGYDEHSAWPIYDEPYLWFSGPFHFGSQLVNISLQANSGSSKTVWTSEILSNDVVSSVLVDGYIYGFDIFEVQSKAHRPSRGKFRCIDLLTGEARWSQGTGRPRRETSKSRDGNPEIGQAGIVVADGKLILLNELGELILLRATADHCDELARATVLGGQLTWTPPTLHRGRVYIRNQSRAVCLYVGEPNLLQNTHATLKVIDVPQTEYSDLAATILAIEPEYAFDIPSQRWLWKWYLASLAILILSEIAGRLGAAPFHRSSREMRSRWISRSFAFITGAMGTTLLSRWTGDFVFTWPVCLFVAFEVAADTQRERDPRHIGLMQALWKRLPLLFFLVVCVSYLSYLPKAQPCF